MERLLDFLLSLSGPMPYVLVFAILLACGLGLPIPEDITLFAAGLLAYYGEANVYVMIAICYFGVMLGDGFVFWLGSKYGRKLTKKWFFSKLLPEDRLEYVRKLLHRRGNRLIFAARFMPGLRAPIYFSAGTLHMRWRVFVLFDGLAALISVPLLVYVTYAFGDQVDKVVKVARRVQNGILIAIGAAIILILLKWYITHRRLKKS